MLMPEVSNLPFCLANFNKLQSRFYLLRLVLLLTAFISTTACESASAPPTPEPLTSFYAKAHALLEQRRFTEAAQTLEQAAEVHPNSPQPLIKIGQIYLRQHRWLLAEDAFNRALVREPVNAPAAAGLAETLLNQGRLGEAGKWWQRAIQFDPAQVGVFTGLGRTYLRLFEFEAAQDAFLQQQGHRFDPRAAWYLAALTAPVNLDKGIAHLHAIPDDAPANLVAHRDYLWAALVPFAEDSPPAEVAMAAGIALTQIESWPLAARALSLAAKQSAALSPQDQAETLAFLGHTQAQSGRPALELFEQAQKLNPASALPLYFKGLYLRRQGALDTAEQAFQKAIALDPQNAALYAEMGHIKVGQGDLATAELWYHAAGQVAAHSGEDELPFQLLLLNFYAERGYLIPEAGIPLAQEILETDPNNARVYDTLGWMQFLSGAADSGEEALQKAVELDPDLINARYHLARYLEATGQAALAKAEYQRVVDGDTAGTYRDAALKGLLRLNAPQD